tara:strand:- start:166 stop:375 length:210 start_codon:yes stop_codon:yes gene_type:complete
MYLGIVIIQLILYIFEITYKNIEKFKENNDYEKGLNPRILKSAIAIEKNNKDILVPDTTTIKIFKSSFL